MEEEEEEEEKEEESVGIFINNCTCTFIRNSEPYGPFFLASEKIVMGQNCEGMCFEA